MGAVYTIPAGIPFVESLAEKIISDFQKTHSSLNDVQILLPTRRACRVLHEVLLKSTKGKSLILPHINAIGDIDEEDLILNILQKNPSEKIENIPPAIPSIKRYILLAKLIHSIPSFVQDFSYAYKLAMALGHFMDQVYTENLSLENLDTLVSEKFAEHWQITLKFLDILKTSWPKILEEEGCIDAADRRNRLIVALADFWHRHPPETPVIAAGTTGSIPAVSKLLKSIINAKEGHLVLPGFDMTLDDEQWEVLSETHPQYGFKHLFESIEFDRKNVKLWHKEHSQISQTWLAQEIMRPGDTSTAWSFLSTSKSSHNHIQNAAQNIKLCICDNEQQEAHVIALALREVLEHPEKTATLITPDRSLARQVSLICKRWNIVLDDSGGQSLALTETGLFTFLVLEVFMNRFDALSLLALLRHPLSKFHDHEAIDVLDQEVLRGMKIKNFNEYIEKANEQKNKKLIDLIKDIEKCFEPLLTLHENTKKEPYDPIELFNAHIQTIENLIHSDQASWEKEVKNLFLSLFEHLHSLPDLELQTYYKLLQTLFSNVLVRPKHGTHPRLQILGQLEARLINTDRVIMAGLNEGSWPSDLAYEPWMSQSMRKDFGLPSYERQIGLAAHDFIQGFCMKDVLITRSLRKNGAPTVPSRWLQRLDAVIQSANIKEPVFQSGPYIKWAQKMDTPQEIKKIERPKPYPPINKRPRKFSVTRIEQWMKDPYSLYAYSILRLKKWNDLNEEFQHRGYGLIVHNILETLMNKKNTFNKEQAERFLKSRADELFEAHLVDPLERAFWVQRYTASIKDFLETEFDFRAQKTYSEINGSLTLSINDTHYEITARADRIDEIQSGFRIVDYKTAGGYTAKQMIAGYAPQLPLEGMILQHGVFESVRNKKPIQSLVYMLFKSGHKPFEIKSLEKDVEDTIHKTHEAIVDLIKTFEQPETPYINIPVSENEPHYNDYAHLARIKEWRMESAE